MLKPGELHVWSIGLDSLNPAELPPPTPGEQARAARFQGSELSFRYLRAHAVLRRVLGRCTGARIEFALAEKGKPYLPFAPEIQFNLSRSRGRAMVAVALEVPVGADVERIRPLPDHLEIAQRFFPPSEAGALAQTPEALREAEFFRRWTRFEAMLKARGVGLYGAGEEVGGEWSVFELPARQGYAGAAAAEKAGMELVLHREFE